MLKICFRCFLTFLLCISASSLMAQDIDVYFIAGQSNAGNIGEQNGTGSTNVGFNLTYGRIGDRASVGGTAPGDLLNAYSSSNLDLNHAVNQLAVDLNAHSGNDIAIFTFGRNGRALTNTVDTATGSAPRQDNGESWYPGGGGTNYDAELYGDFQAWSAQRLADLSAANSSANINVNGVFWFQGEEDVLLDNSGQESNAVDNYGNNLDALVNRFQQDFNNDIAVVATKLRRVGNTNELGLVDDVNAAIELSALNSDQVGFVETTVNIDGTGGNLAGRFGAGDVHFTNDAQETIVQRWAAESIRIQSLSSVPEPGTFGMGCFLLAICGMSRRRL